MLRLIDRLFAFPAANIPAIQRELDISYPTASSWIQTLESDGILTEVTGRKKNRLYVATPIFSKLNDPPFSVQQAELANQQSNGPETNIENSDVPH
jgi:hypothetical protein